MDKMDALAAWELEANAKDALKEVGIADANMRVKAMSGGQARKVAVASALLGTPDVLILDEPTNHMDVQVRDGLPGVTTAS
jgi:ABC transport system ATP-binding/permease protein